jgi:type II secretory pathway pseudopilin PulG
VKSRGEQRAFALTELLVVVATIVILAAILFPVFQQAREQARMTACLSNEKQIGMAARMYMEDNEGALFHHHEQWVRDDGTQAPNLPQAILAMPPIGLPGDPLAGLYRTLTEGSPPVNARRAGVLLT